MGKPSRAASHLPFNYPQLQNLIKRDPESYREEFLQQYQHFKSSLAILLVQPDAVEEHFEALVMFISHVVSYFKEQASEFPTVLMELLSQESAGLPSSLRRCLVQCLLLVRKKKLVELEKVLTLFFRLFRVKDKLLREVLYDAIVGEIRRANQPHRNNALNKTLQNFMFSQLHQQSLLNEGKRARNDSAEAIASHKALQVMIELYRRGIWNDSKTVNVVAEACTSQISYKVTVTALNFFLGRCKKKAALSLADESESESEDESDEEGGDKKNTPSVKEMLYKMQVAGCTKARKTKMKRFMAAKKKQENAEKKDSDNSTTAFSAIHLLNDPYGFVEKLFKILSHSNDSFEFKLLMINVITRVIGAHKLIFLDLYSFLLRYIQPHQKSISQVLAYAAQASHELVPPDVISPVVKAIANNFVSDHCRNEVIAAGLNGLTQICARCPLSMDSTLLQDLANYKGYNDKSVMMAARGLISLYREKNPELLHRKDRGKEASMAIQRGQFSGPKQYGRTEVALDIDGAELLLDKDESDGSGSGDEGNDEWVECSSDFDDSSEEQDEASDEGFLELDSEEDIEVSDDSQSEDAESNEESEGEEDGEKVKEVNKMMSLATQTIFSAEDFARLKRKRLEAAVEASNSSSTRIAKKKTKILPDDGDSDDDEATGPEEVVRPKSIEVLAKKPKADYATRMESIKAGREGRLAFGSKKGKETRGSKTNAEKSKQKNAIMMAHKYSVKQKKQRSLRDVQKVQRAHVKRMKLKRK